MDQPRFRRVLNLFLASPGDVPGERELARRVVEEVNRSVGSPWAWQIDLYGWEDVRPGYGRPQTLINQDVDRCDAFVGLLHQRWGQPTGADGFSSGFEEEFERAVERRRRTGAPEIMVAFRRVETPSDPGPQMQRVLEFRARLEREKQLYYAEFTDAADWEAKLRQWVTQELTKRIQEALAPPPPAEDVSGAAGTPDAPQRLPERTEEDAVELPLPQQVREIALRVRDAARTETAGSFGEMIERLDEFDVVRLLLAARTAAAYRFTTDELGTRDVNRLYLHRAQIDASPLERFVLFRALVADRDDVVPGWYWPARLGNDPHGSLKAVQVLAPGEERTVLRLA